MSGSGVFDDVYRSDWYYEPVTWAAGAARWAVDQGILRGSEDLFIRMMLNPRTNAARAEIAAMVERYCESSQE